MYNPSKYLTRKIIDAATPEECEQIIKEIETAYTKDDITDNLRNQLTFLNNERKQDIINSQQIKNDILNKFKD